MTPPFAAVEVDIVPPYIRYVSVSTPTPGGSLRDQRRRMIRHSGGAQHGEFNGQIRLIYAKDEIKLAGRTEE
jgi:hypothetical protein